MKLKLATKEPIHIVFIFALAAGLLASCNLPAGQQAPLSTSISTQAVFTQAAETIIAGLTQVAPPATQTPAPASPTTPAETAATETPAATVTSGPTATEQVEPSETASATDTPAVALPATPTAPARILFEEDFSDETGWFTEQNEDFTIQFAEEGYLVSVEIIEAFIWSVRTGNYADVILEVDAAQTSGPEGGLSGLVCRHQDEANYYALVIGSDGTYGILKNEGGETEYLQEGAAPSGVIQGGESPNRIRAACIGDRLSLYANGQLLAEVQDTSFDTGDVGLVAGTRETAGVDVLFDNFVIYQP
jgi:hypothetical protein